ncbi:amino acid/amide ABC transporter membrane protein 2 (HAAT family) [Acidovorax sp. 100]|uniref:branched-chain amino acid ABC transporter permease n=1 Tax=Acidovorax sp. 100 TaxID=2135635 RepID=UPI000EF9790C|nr:branched-chain amino acid ABC transporter permease [Acidovorax sp. 100]RMA59944.1 amino acid/amide ABC transporter membrane protein 2 (HAAT family) [Acidovorax sp. 100]
MTTIPQDSILSRHRWRVGELLWLAVALACYFLLPQYLALGTTVLIMVVLVMSFDLLLGFSGVLSLGHAVFFGLGAYAAGWLSLAGWTEPVSAVIVAGVASAGLAAVVGPFLLRLTGLPLMMVTLALGVLVFEAAHKATTITGGDDGLAGIQFAPILGIFEWGLGGATAYLYVLTWLCVVFVLLKRVVASPFGVMLQGVRENSARMRLIGNLVLPHLTLAYVISGTVAGMAGALFTQANAFVGLGVLAVDTSVDVLVMLVLGGIGGLHGALVGAPVYMMLKHFSSQWNPFYWMLVIGLLLIVVVLFGRGGILGILQSAMRCLRKDKT